MSQKTSEAPSPRGLAIASSEQVDAHSITDLRVSKHAAYAHRLGTIEVAVARYGPVALLPPLEPGPAECLARCEFCARRWVA